MQIAELRAHAKSSELRPRMDHVCMQGSTSQTCVHSSLVRIMMMMLPSRIIRKQMNRTQCASRFKRLSLEVTDPEQEPRALGTRQLHVCCQRPQMLRKGERERDEPRTSKWQWPAQDSAAQDPGNFLFLVLNPFRYWLPHVLMHVAPVLVLNCISDSQVSGFTATCIWNSQGSGNLKEVGCSKAQPSSKSLSIRGVKEKHSATREGEGEKHAANDHWT